MLTRGSQPTDIDTEMSEHFGEPVVEVHKVFSSRIDGLYSQNAWCLGKFTTRYDPSVWNLPSIVDSLLFCHIKLDRIGRTGYGQQVWRCYVPVEGSELYNSPSQWRQPTVDLDDFWITRTINDDNAVFVRTPIILAPKVFLWKQITLGERSVGYNAKVFVSPGDMNDPGSRVVLQNLANKQEIQDQSIKSILNDQINNSGDQHAKDIEAADPQSDNSRAVERSYRDHFRML